MGAASATSEAAFREFRRISEFLTDNLSVEQQREKPREIRSMI